MPVLLDSNGEEILAPLPKDGLTLTIPRPVADSAECEGLFLVFMNLDTNGNPDEATTKVAAPTPCESGFEITITELCPIAIAFRTHQDVQDSGSLSLPTGQTLSLAPERLCGPVLSTKKKLI